MVNDRVLIVVVKCSVVMTGVVVAFLTVENKKLIILNCGKFDFTLQ